MMRELADNILDIAQNSIVAGASLVEIDISVSRAQDTVSLAFIDDGCGMSEDMVKAVCDPFTTTRKTRKVGLGLPLLKMTAQATGAAIPMNALFAWLHGDNASVSGWTADLSRQSEGRISATRTLPAPEVALRVVLDQ